MITKTVLESEILEISRNMDAGRRGLAACHRFMQSNVNHPAVPFNLALQLIGIRWFTLGNELSQEDMLALAAAEGYAKQAVGLAPHSVECHSLLAAILINSWKWVEATEVLDHIFSHLIKGNGDWRRINHEEHIQIQRNVCKLWGLFSLRQARHRDAALSQPKLNVIEAFAGPNAQSGWNRDWSLFSNPISMTAKVVDYLRFFEAFSGARRFPDIMRIGAQIPPGYEALYRNLMAQLPSHLKISVPRIFGEIGWDVDGQVVNANILKDLDHFVQLANMGILDKLLSQREKRPLRILEIGPGYGGLTYMINSVLQAHTLVVVDLLDSIGFSSTYLTLACGFRGTEVYFHDGFDANDLARHKGIAFVPEFLSSDLIGQGNFDLIVNTGSFGEMSGQEVANYIGIINNILAPDGVVYDVNNSINDLVDTLFQGTIIKIQEYERIWMKNNDPMVTLRMPAQPWGQSARFHSQMDSEWFHFMS
jgi:hypothetical protein